MMETLHYTPKIRLETPRYGRHHRSGWQYAIECIKPLTTPTGIYFDGVIEKRFVFGRDPGDRNNNWEPHQTAWIGVFHNPPVVPQWFGRYASADDIIASPQWHDSLERCAGIITLSGYLAEWLSRRVAVPIMALCHPTQMAPLEFSMDAFIASNARAVIHIGWWLRRFHSFFSLRTGLHKILLHINRPWVNAAMNAEMKLTKGVGVQMPKIIPHLDNATYDRLLSRNVVFLDVYDASANNVVIECIARNTPLVVTKHPAIQEYLGKEYPGYFTECGEATELLNSIDHLSAMHDYLRVHRELKDRLLGQRFVSDLANSAIYNAL